MLILTVVGRGRPVVVLLRSLLPDSPLRSAAGVHRICARPIGQRMLSRVAQIYPFQYSQGRKAITFLGNSLECLRDFPEDARQDAGYALDQVQRGNQPSDFKPMAAVGKRVEELRVWDDAGT
jgi:hypothetical protein